jgi:hypothetical protein
MSDKRNQFTYSLVFEGGASEWRIYELNPDGCADHIFNEDRKPLFTFPWCEAHDEGLRPPLEVRAKYEELIGYDPTYEGKPFVNLVEMIDDGEAGGFNQPCRYGNLCEGHAVYCHNEKWLYGPRKCRRTWYTGGDVRDEDCEGYEPNPHFAQGIAAESDETQNAAQPVGQEPGPEGAP